jgi:hypothetical protein
MTGLFHEFAVPERLVFTSPAFEDAPRQSSDRNPPWHFIPRARRQDQAALTLGEL